MGEDGKIDIFNLASSTHVIVDVMGYYVGSGNLATGGQYQPLLPQRAFDSREYGSKVKLPAFTPFKFALNFGGAANPHVRAWAVNITAVAPDAGGYLTAWNGQKGQLPGTRH